MIQISYLSIDSLIAWDRRVRVGGRVAESAVYAEAVDDIDTRSRSIVPQS